MRVHYGEGVAIHTDPESCAGHCREAVREALIGGRTGEVLSGVRQVRGADVFRPTEDAMGRAARTMAPSSLQRINGASHATAERFE